MDYSPKGFRHAPSQLILMLGKTLHRQIKISRYEGLQTVAVKLNELAQKPNGQEILTFCLFLKYYLCQDGSRYVFSRPGIAHLGTVAALGGNHQAAVRAEPARRARRSGLLRDLDPDRGNSGWRRRRV